MGSFLHEFRVAVRQLAGHTGFAIIVVVTLALGIGATTTCFAVLNAVAFKPIPFAEPDRLVGLRLLDRSGSGRSQLSLDTFAALEQTRGVFSSSAAYGTRTVTVAGAGVAERVQAAEVSGDVFSLLGVSLQRGRPLTAADAGTRVIVIGDDLWVRGLGSNPDVIGTTITLDGDAYVVVGVAGRGFGFPHNSRVWMPLDRTSGTRPVDVVARLGPGVSVARADVTLSTISTDAPTTIPLRRLMIGTKQRDMALFVLAAAGLVLLVACANLAGLLAAHIHSRKYEMALRAAIGAGRLRLVRQLMTESAMLAVAGGTIGLIFAQWGVDLLSTTLGKPQGADWITFAVDGRVVAFAVAASAITALVFGLAPAVGGTRVDLRGVLQGDSGTSGAAPGPRRVRGLLVAGQLAVSIALVSGAASIVMSSMRFDDTDPGFDRGGIMAVRVALVGSAYAHPEQRFAFVDAATNRLRSLPGVASVTAVSHLPLIDRDVPYTSFALEETASTARPSFASVRFVDAGYIAAMGIPVHRGRAFTTAEARDLRDRAVLINETMARRYWPDRDPIGTRLRVAGIGDTEGWRTIVGVVGDVSQRQLPAAPENQMYLPLAPAREVSLVVRAASDFAVLAPRARDAVQAIDRSLAIGTNTMKAAYEWYARDRRLQGLAIGVLGATAVLLAGLGVYGVMSLMVSARSREIAIRMALGSSPHAVQRLMLGRGLTLASTGVAVGLLLAGALTAFLSSVFLGVRAFDGLVLSAAAALLGAVTLLSSWWPARRAMRVDPMVTLKQ
ncbi:MAG TPA: ADOP family duplicated permease [Vicinamibacterales bacterium]|nr:ADOP family duplicated permease [Vicinamibacterales bacterium]